MAGTNSNLKALPTDSPNHKWNVDIYGPGLITANSWLLETVEMYINEVQVEKVNIVKYLAAILCKDGSSTVDILHQDRNNYSSNGWELRLVLALSTFTTLFMVPWKAGRCRDGE